jgi:hypothetical protein
MRIPLSFYQANGATSNCLQDAEREFLVAQGMPIKANSDMWFELLSSLGYTGALGDMINHFWDDGGEITTPALLETEVEDLLSMEVEDFLDLDVT